MASTRAMGAQMLNTMWPTTKPSDDASPIPTTGTQVGPTMSCQ